MICAVCRQAGSLNAEANASADPAEAQRLLRKARKLHNRCHDCDCQHRTGFYVNQEMIRLNAVRN